MILIVKSHDISYLSRFDGRRYCWSKCRCECWFKGWSHTRFCRRSSTRSIRWFISRVVSRCGRWNNWTGGWFYCFAKATWWFLTQGTYVLLEPINSFRYSRINLEDELKLISAITACCTIVEQLTTHNRENSCCTTSRH